jgi:general stress protein YciG
MTTERRLAQKNFHFTMSFQGFAAMKEKDPERQKQIASKGGKASGIARKKRIVIKPPMESFEALMILGEIAAIEQEEHKNTNDDQDYIDFHLDKPIARKSTIFCMRNEGKRRTTRNSSETSMEVEKLEQAKKAGDWDKELTN